MRYKISSEFFFLQILWFKNIRTCISPIFEKKGSKNFRKWIITGWPNSAKLKNNLGEKKTSNVVTNFKHKSNFFLRFFALLSFTIFFFPLKLVFYHFLCYVFTQCWTLEWPVTRKLPAWTYEHIFQRDVGVKERNSFLKMLYFFFRETLIFKLFISLLCFFIYFL